MRNVVVTGGSRGLGLAIAMALVDDGFHVITVARSEGAELRAAIDSKHRTSAGSLSFRACDLSQSLMLGGFVGALRKEFGPLYGLINNAGMGSARILTLMKDHEVRDLVGLNTITPILMSKHVLRSMLLERAGRIVNLASIVATTGYSGLSVYSATKASLLGFTRSLAREVGQLGITVNAVAPGFIDTDMTRELDEDQRKKIANRSALKRMASADDVAGAVSYLMSERARNITGITLTVDAGSSA